MRGGDKNVGPNTVTTARYRLQGWREGGVGISVLGCRGRSDESGYVRRESFQSSRACTIMEGDAVSCSARW